MLDESVHSPRGLPLVGSQAIGDLGECRAVEKHGEQREITLVEARHGRLEILTRHGGDDGLAMRDSADGIQHFRRRRTFVDKAVGLRGSRGDGQRRARVSGVDEDARGCGAGLDAAAQRERVSPAGS